MAGDCFGSNFMCACSMGLVSPCDDEDEGDDDGVACKSADIAGNLRGGFEGVEKVGVGSVFRILLKRDLLLVQKDFDDEDSSG